MGGASLDVSRVSIFADFMVDLIRPGVDSSAQVRDLAEAVLLEVFDRLDTAGAHLADSDDLFALVQLAQPLRELSQGDQVATDIGYLVFVLVAYIQQEKVVSLIEALLEFFGLNFWNAHSDFSLVDSQNTKPTYQWLPGVGVLKCLRN